MAEDRGGRIPPSAYVQPTLEEFDQEAMSVRENYGCRLAVFTAALDPTLHRVLLVQLGDYARGSLQGNPWSLPGGAVEAGERPSAAACREVQEETAVTMDATALQPCAWIRRPYIEVDGSRGELLLLFAATLRLPVDPRPSPPETLQAAMVDYDLQHWWQTPSTGSGQASLQPLRRHWIHWTELAHGLLRDSGRPLRTYTYASPQAMAMPMTDDGDANQTKDSTL